MAMPHSATAPLRDVSMTALVEKVVRHEDLTETEASFAMHEVMEGRVAPAALAGLLTALAMKGERPHEIVGFARAMRAHAVTLAAPVDEVFDTCGTGGDRAGTFNVSSTAAVVIAGAGVTVAKHGNRSVSSQCGSADVFEALGVNVAAPPPVVERCLTEARIAFFFAPTFHPSMRHAGPTRRELGLRTAFNLLGPLTNPARATRQIVGVPRPELTELLARALMMLGSERAWVVHGSDGLDEISTAGYTKVSECRDGAVHTFHVHPADFGLAKAAPSALQGGDAATNAAIVRAVLDGAAGAARDVVLLNAGAALLVAGRAASVREGIAQAAAAIDGGQARAALDAMIKASRAGVAA
jgi:anthranilate phosphoribosyltransferase